MKKLLLSLSLLGSIAAFAEVPQGWTDDFAAAKKQAAAEKKDLLVDFSGSDWCGWCIKLDKEVLSQPEFVTTASKEFVLVLVDSPRDKARLSETAKQQNPDLVKQYQIRGYPSVLLMDADGKVYAKTGYKPGGPTAYLKDLAETKAFGKKKQATLAEAEKLAGAEKAKALDALVSAMPSAEKYGEAETADLIKQIVELDPALKAKYPFFTEIKPLQKQTETSLAAIRMQTRNKIKETATANGGKPDKTVVAQLQEESQKEIGTLAGKALEKTEKAIAANKIQGEDLQQTKLFEATLYNCLNPGKPNMPSEKVLAAYKEAYEAAPTTEIGKRLHDMLESAKNPPPPPQPPPPPAH